MALAALAGVFVLTVIAFKRVHDVAKHDRPLFAGASVQTPPQIDMRAASQMPPHSSTQSGQQPYTRPSNDPTRRDNYWQ